MDLTYGFARLEGRHFARAVNGRLVIFAGARRFRDAEALDRGGETLFPNEHSMSILCARGRRAGIVRLDCHVAKESKKNAARSRRVRRPFSAFRGQTSQFISSRTTPVVSGDPAKYGNSISDSGNSFSGLPVHDDRSERRRRRRRPRCRWMSGRIDQADNCRKEAGKDRILRPAPIRRKKACKQRRACSFKGYFLARPPTFMRRTRRHISDTSLTELPT